MKRIVLVLGLLAGGVAARADEGMWTYNHFPSDRVKQKYGFSPDDKWLEHARLSSARISQGCSASFVSDNGLVMTNHHCARSCVQQLSTPQRDMVAQGFYAKKLDDEVKCPEMEINQLIEISDVTARINKATAGLADKAYN
ncbi:MAG TPA: S46 family peptidase, partial [Polyangia bacterium]|nr:S46 family peptidase [Polyangia bacterium]